MSQRSLSRLADALKVEAESVFSFRIIKVLLISMGLDALGRNRFSIMPYALILECIDLSVSFRISGGSLRGGPKIACLSSFDES